MKKHHQRPLNNYDFLLALNSPSLSAAVLNSYRERCGTLICADGAADRLLEQGIRPDRIAGDMDSRKKKVPPASKAQLNSDQPIRIETLPDQNSSDAEKILRLLHEEGMSSGLIMGMTGGRLDHAWMNQLILHDYSRYMLLDMVDDSSYSCFLQPGEYTLSALPGEIFSLLPMGPVNNITLIGAEYRLNKDRLDNPGRTLSNRALSAQFTLEFSGSALVYIRPEVLHPVPPMPPPPFSAAENA